jgi:ribosome-associated protein
MARSETPLLQIGRLAVYADEVEWQAVRAQGSGGQNLHKTESAVQLRYDLHAGSLPDDVRERLLAGRDRRLSADGVFVIKAQRLRSQDRNRAEALERLGEWIAGAAEPPKPRKPTRPTAAARRRRLEAKTRRSALKAGRGKLLE